MKIFLDLRIKWDDLRLWKMDLKGAYQPLSLRCEVDMCFSIETHWSDYSVLIGPSYVVYVGG